jgi:hypothetical protein
LPVIKKYKDDASGREVEESQFKPEEWIDLVDQLTGTRKIFLRADNPALAALFPPPPPPKEEA